MSSLPSFTSRPEFSPRSLLRMLWKSRLFASVVWVALAGAAAVAVSLIPPTYRAETLILVDSQKIPEKYVSATVNADVQDRLATINQRILSGTRLAKIVDDFQLYREERKSATEEEILDRVRSDIDVRLERGWTGNRPGAFRISYRSRVPALAADVANRLASAYIEENLRTREVQAEGTSEFLDNQLQEAKKRLDGLEAAVSRYKLAHNGELPEQEGSLSGTLSRLHTELQGVQDAINRAQQNRVLLENTVDMAEAAESAAQRGSRPAPAPPPAQEKNPAAPKRSDVIALQLSAMRIRYGDEYPDVRRLASELEKAREQERQEQPAAPPKTDPSPAPSPAAQPDQTELLRARQRAAASKAQLALLDKELAARGADRQRILRDIAAYEARLQHLPVREQEMASLTRDYEISKANYRSLLDKKLSAEMATEMERRQKAERFTVLDPARVPEKPYRPNRPVLWLSACAVASGIAILLSLAKELRKGVLLGEWELPEHVRVLGRVPPFRSARRRWRLPRLWKRRPLDSERAAA